MGLRVFPIVQIKAVLMHKGTLFLLIMEKGLFGFECDFFVVVDAMDLIGQCRLHAFA